MWVPQWTWCSNGPFLCGCRNGPGALMDPPKWCLNGPIWCRNGPGALTHPNPMRQPSGWPTNQMFSHLNDWDERRNINKTGLIRMLLLCTVSVTKTVLLLYANNPNISKRIESTWDMWLPSHSQLLKKNLNLFTYIFFVCIPWWNRNASEWRKKGGQRRKFIWYKFAQKATIHARILWKVRVWANQGIPRLAGF